MAMELWTVATARRVGDMDTTQINEDTIVFLPSADTDGQAKRSPRGKLLGKGNRLCRRCFAMPVCYLIRKAKELGNSYLNSPASETGGEVVGIEPYFSVPVVPPATL